MSTQITMLPGFEDHDPEYYTKYDVPTEHLMSALNIVATFDCPTHDPKVLCLCPIALATLTPKLSNLYKYLGFILEWEQHILQFDAAHTLTSSVDSKRAFKTSSGRSPEQLAGKFAKATFAAPFMFKPAISMNEVVAAMLDFWYHKADYWRSEYADMTAVRANEAAWQPGDATPYFYRDLSTPDPTYPPQIGKRLILQRTRLWDPENDRRKLHRCVVYFMPMQPRTIGGISGPSYRLVATKPCHEGCRRWRMELSVELVEEIAVTLTIPGWKAMDLFRMENGRYWSMPRREEGGVRRIGQR